MQNQKIFFACAVLFIGAILYSKWLDFNAPEKKIDTQVSENIGLKSDENAVSLPNLPLSGPSQEETNILVGTSYKSDIITVETDLLKILINTKGGVIEKVELKDEPVSIEQKNQGYALLKNTTKEVFIAQDGILSLNKNAAPNHLDTQYSTSKKHYMLEGEGELKVPLKWVSSDQVEFTKVFVFKGDSYLVEIDYDIVNHSNNPWQGYLYAQFSRSEPTDIKTGFGQLPSYVGPVIYTESEKYEKVDFDDVAKSPKSFQTQRGWVAMIQHYFAAAWLPNVGSQEYFVKTANGTVPLQYQLGFKQLNPTVIQSQQTATIHNKVYLGSKEHKQLRSVEKHHEVEGLSLTVDYGMLTFIADPLFTVLSWINRLVNNWGWSIIILTILIKLAFYPLSAKSFRSMAGMKKLQPRLQTLKERYKDDRQKLQMEMMALYKKEKVNPMGGCLPILIQIPVFIALYWVLLESVEMRHAPFALWWQDLSAPDPYYVLPVLMGASMWLQQKMNPAPMEDIQKKVMMIMPIALTFLFLSFPQGLVLYWVVNNVLTIVQQWFIYRQNEA